MAQNRFGWVDVGRTDPSKHQNGITTWNQLSCSKYRATSEVKGFSLPLCVLCGAQTPRLLQMLKEGNGKFELPDVYVFERKVREGYTTGIIIRHGPKKEKTPS